MKSAYDVPTQPSVSSASSAVCEVLVLTLVVSLGVGCAKPHDPLLLDAAFPWLTLLPLLLGAQHGALAGAGSAALLGAVGVLHAQLGGGTGLHRLVAFVGGCLAVGVLAGFFRDRAHARLARLEHESRESTRRLSRLGREHVVLELSHRRLEEQLAARRWSIASAFRDAQRALAGGASLATIGDVVLGVLSNHAFVQSASLVSATPDARGGYALQPSRSLAGPAHVDLEHRLVRRALDTGRLVALDAESLDLDARDSDARDSIVAVAPLRSVGGRLLGLVLVHEMPFMAFQAENLENLAALTALLADLLEDRFLDPAGEESHQPPAESPPRSVSRSGTYRRRRFAQSA